jgi:uncharacterized lipoprotein YmbA
MILTRWRFAALALTIALAGCSILEPAPERSKFLVLTPISPASTTTSVQSAAGRPLALGLGPVTLPQYLDRPEVVVRNSQNTLELSPVDRWAEPLTDNFRTVLAANLMTLLGTNQVVMYPWFANSRLDYAISVNVQQFEVNTTDGAQLIARWTIRDPRSGATLLNRETNVSEPLSSHDAQAIAAGLSAALGDLGRQIAQALRQL